MSTLQSLMAEDLARPAPADLDPLAEAIRQRHGQAVRGILLYGSCRRSQEAGEGLVDLLVIVDAYRSAHGQGLAALLNFVLPPNVYYLEADAGERRIRCKYAVIRLDQFRRRCQSRSDHYFWARFSQPCRLLWADSAPVRTEIADIRGMAACHYAQRIVPLLERPVSAEAFWTLALSRTYRCELRPEPPGNAARLIASDPGFWIELSRALAEEGRSRLVLNEGLLAPARSSTIRRRLAQGNWALRRVSGKLYNLARLFKAAGTFSNGIDYIVWKVERHSGVKVEPTARMRRHPRLAAWGLAWRMWRQGGFR